VLRQLSKDIRSPARTEVTGSCSGRFAGRGLSETSYLTIT